MNAYQKKLTKTARRVWTTKEVPLGNSRTLIPAGMEGVLMSGKLVNGNFMVWFFPDGRCLSRRRTEGLGKVVKGD